MPSIAKWKGTAPIVRQIHDSLQGRLSAELATISAGLFTSPTWDHITLAAPDTDAAYWRTAQFDDPPPEAYHTPSIGVVVGESNVVDGGGLGEWLVETEFLISAWLSEADNGAQTKQDSAEVGDAYVSGVFNVLSAHLKDDAESDSTSGTSLGLGLPVVYVRPNGYSPVTPLNFEFDDAGRPIGPWFYVGEVALAVGHHTYQAG